jgi:hypothetical protein
MVAANEDVALAAETEDAKAAVVLAAKEEAVVKEEVVAVAEDAKAETVVAVLEISLAVAVKIEVVTLAEAEDVKAVVVKEDAGLNLTKTSFKKSSGSSNARGFFFMLRFLKIFHSTIV